VAQHHRLIPRDGGSSKYNAKFMDYSTDGLASRELYLATQGCQACIRITCGVLQHLATDFDPFDYGFRLDSTR